MKNLCRIFKPIAFAGLIALVSAPLGCSLNQFKKEIKPEHEWYNLNGIWYEDTNDSLKPLSPKYNPDENDRILKGTTQVDPEDRMLDQKAVREYFKKHQYQTNF